MQYSLTMCCHRLGGISLYTLRQWCERAGIELEEQKSISDPRQKWLTDEQLKQLALAHGRVLDQSEPGPEPIPPNAYKLLIEQVARSLQQAEQIHAEHAAIQASINELRGQQDSAAHKFTGIEQAQARRDEAEQQTAETLHQLDKQVSMFRATEVELRERYQHAHSTFEQYQRQTNAALEAVTARQQAAEKQLAKHELSTRDRAAQQDQAQALLQNEVTQQASDIRQLTARVDKQGQQIAQLAEQVQALDSAIQDQAKQGEQREAALRAAFRDELNKLYQQVNEEFERRVQGIEAEQARDAAHVATQAERQGERLDKLVITLDSATSTAEEARATANGTAGRLSRIEKAVDTLEAQRQSDQAEQAALEQTINRLATQAPQEQQGGAPEQPRTGRKRAARSSKG